MSTVVQAMPSASKETRVCAQCGKPVTRYRSQFRRDAPAFCDKRCQGAYKSEHGTGANAANWRGGTRVSKDYIEVYAPWSDLAGDSGYVPLHILVFTLANGRSPRPGMVVHHDDENKLNNHPSNLIEMTQAEHARLHGLRRGGLNGG
jgi:hypothetical protein